MGTSQEHSSGPSGIPDVLTVEEAAVLMRVGRTKAYAMAQQWRASGGRSGLPVVDLGDVLRVPRRALEELMGVEFTAPPPPKPAPNREQTTNRRRSTNRTTNNGDQLELFNRPPQSPNG